MTGYFISADALHAFLGLPKDCVITGAGRFDAMKRELYIAVATNGPLHHPAPERPAARPTPGQPRQLTERER